MTEAKIPERWKGLHRMLGWIENPDQAQKAMRDIIEQLGAAENDRDTLRAEVERLKGDYNVLLDDCIDMRSELAQVRRYDKD